MLAGKFRLKGKFYIERSKKRGTLHQFKHFGLCVYQREKDSTKPSQFAFVISTKVAKLAVDRNRIKRMMSEAVRFQLNSIPRGYDVVFLAKTSIAREPTDVVMNEVKKALVKTNIVVLKP